MTEERRSSSRKTTTTAGERKTEASDLSKTTSPTASAAAAAAAAECNKPLAVPVQKALDALDKALAADRTPTGMHIEIARKAAITTCAKYELYGRAADLAVDNVAFAKTVFDNVQWNHNRRISREIYMNALAKARGNYVDSLLQASLFARHAKRYVIAERYAREYLQRANNVNTDGVTIVAVGEQKTRSELPPLQQVVRVTALHNLCCIYYKAGWETKLDAAFDDLDNVLKPLPGAPADTGHFAHELSSLLRESDCVRRVCATENDFVRPPLPAAPSLPAALATETKVTKDAREEKKDDKQETKEVKREAVATADAKTDDDVTKLGTRFDYMSLDVQKSDGSTGVIMAKSKTRGVSCKAERKAICDAIELCRSLVKKYPADFDAVGSCLMARMYARLEEWKRVQTWLEHARAVKRRYPTQFKCSKSVPAELPERIFTTMTQQPPDPKERDGEAHDTWVTECAGIRKFLDDGLVPLHLFFVLPADAVPAGAVTSVCTHGASCSTCKTNDS